MNRHHHVHRRPAFPNKLFWTVPKSAEFRSETQEFYNECRDMNPEFDTEVFGDEEAAVSIEAVAPAGLHCSACGPI